MDPGIVKTESYSSINHRKQNRYEAEDEGLLCGPFSYAEERDAGNKWVCEASVKGDGPDVEMIPVGLCGRDKNVEAARSKGEVDPSHCQVSKQNWRKLEVAARTEVPSPRACEISPAP